MQDVLVVDDDWTIRQTLSELLEMEGYRAQTAEHGGPALEIMRASTQHLVVLLDLSMPYVDAQEVLEAVAADEALARRHAIIMMTASASAGTKGRLAELCAQLDTPVIRTPFTEEKLTHAVEQAAARLTRE